MRRQSTTSQSQIQIKMQNILKACKKERNYKQFKQIRSLLLRDIQNNELKQQIIQFQRLLDYTTIKAGQKKYKEALHQFQNVLVKLTKPSSSTLLLMFSQKISLLIELIVTPKEKNLQQHLCYVQQLQIKLLSFFDSLQQDTLKQQSLSFFEVLKPILKGLQSKTTNLKLLEKLLLIFDAIMNPPNQTIYIGFKDLDLISKIIELIESGVFEQNDEYRQLALKIIFRYLESKHQFDKTKGIYIISKAKKQKIMSFCLSFLDSRREEILEFTLGSMHYLIQQQEDFTQIISIKQAALKAVCQLIASNQRNVLRLSIKIIDKVIYSNSNLLNTPFLDKFSLVDLIQTQLRKQLCFQDKYTEEIVQLAANILCNITLAQSKQLQRKLYKHKIWDLILNNFQRGSPLLPLMATFQWYLEIIPEIQVLNITKKYLEAIGELQKFYLDEKYKILVQQTILRLQYYFKQKIPSQIQKFISFVEINKLNEYLSQQLELQRNESI